MRSPKRFATRPARVAVVMLALVATTATVVVVRSRAPEPIAAPAIQQAPTITGEPSPSPSPTPSAPKPTPKPKAPPRVAAPKPAPKPAPEPPPSADLSAFRRLAVWVDSYDYAALDPDATATAMRQRGVRAIFIQTGRYTLPDDFKDAAVLERWVRAAHANGMKIVGWYLPGYGDMTRDLRRTLAIARFRTSDGQRFDGIGVDIEDKCEIADSSPCNSAPQVKGFTREDWNGAIVTHMLRVRAALGTLYPMGGIVPPPLGMAIRPANWEGFPWRDLPRGFNVVMPMSYWGYRDDCDTNPQHCAYGYTRGNIDEVRRLTGVLARRIHIIGGVGDQVTDAEVADFVRASREARILGGSLYDYRTTKSGFWSSLAKLNLL